MNKKDNLLSDLNQTFDKLTEELDFMANNNISKKDRIEIIDDFIHFLQFTRRLTLLNQEQIDHMSSKLSSRERSALDNVQDDEEKFNELISSFARSSYFREIAWINFLNGHDPDPPVGPSSKELEDSIMKDDKNA